MWVTGFADSYSTVGANSNVDLENTRSLFCSMVVIVCLNGGTVCLNDGIIVSSYGR